MMKQAIAGVTPFDTREVPVMTVWPSNGASSIGRTLGRLYALPFGFYIFKLGNLIALASIPIALALYFIKVLPFVGRRYRITNRRVVVARGVTGIEEEKSVNLDRFDRIEVEVLPGQEWYHAGDLVFYQGKTETFRLEGVSRPDVFQAICTKAQQSYVGVQSALATQA